MWLLLSQVCKIENRLVTQSPQHSHIASMKDNLQTKKVRNDLCDAQLSVKMINFSLHANPPAQRNYCLADGRVPRKTISIIMYSLHSAKSTVSPMLFLGGKQQGGQWVSLRRHFMPQWLLEKKAFSSHSQWEKSVEELENYTVLSSENVCTVHS